MVLPHLSGGAVDPEETTIEAAKREMMEESGWVGINFKQIKIPGNWKLDISEEDQLIYFPNWKINKDFKSETYIFILCEAVDFNPTSQYGIEKDDHEFVLNDIKLIHDLTKNSISKDKRREFQKQFRLKCFDYLKV